VPLPAPVAPAPTSIGLFPVQGPHSLGGDAARFGAARNGHVHQGQDVLAAEGTPVVAPLAGTVTVRDVQPSGAGLYLVLDAVDGRSFFFAHCQEDSFAVDKLQVVAAGQQLCRVGRTGSASVAHLHLEIWIGGWRRDRASAPIDPLPQLLAWGG
jgi:murein DD-endopeptidase MepM/ murein hydrolase activator NlpD